MAFDSVDAVKVSANSDYYREVMPMYLIHIDYSYKHSNFPHH